MERRVDPDDGEARTLADMQTRYKGVYSDKEIEAYFFDECTPVPAAAHGPGSDNIEGLDKWLEDRGLEEYAENVLAWCRENGAVSIKEIEDNFEDVKAAILASEIDPGDKVRVTVLKGKWQGQYVAVVLESTAKGVTLRHVEDDYVETLPWNLLGGQKYSMEPVSDDEEEAGHEKASSSLRTGRLRVDPAMGAGLELRWVKVGYHVDSIEAKPGQSDLWAGDAIVAIGSAILVGLDEDAVEERFGQSYGDNVGFVAGPLNELLRQPVDDVRIQAERMLATIKN